MPIFDQGYQHWSGHLSSHAWRWFAITRRGIRTATQGRIVRLALVLAYLPAILLVVVLGSGKLLAQGQIQELKQLHEQTFDMRLKSEMGAFADKLTTLGCTTEFHDDLLRVRIPAGQSPQLLWEVAAAQNEQIRYLRPQRSTLEEVFLNALERT